MRDLVAKPFALYDLLNWIDRGRMTGGYKACQSDLICYLANKLLYRRFVRIIFKVTNKPLDPPPASPPQRSVSSQAEPERSPPSQKPFQAPSQPRYHVFISYNETDLDWVRNVLVPRLQEAGVQVTVDYRDFIAGGPRLIEIEQAVKNNQHTIVVLTPAWLEDDWNAFEGLLLRTLDPAARQRKLIPLLLQRCEQLPEAVASLERVDFTDEEHWEREFKRLIRAIKEPPLVQQQWIGGRVVRRARQHPVISTTLAVSIFVLLTLVVVLQLPGFFDAIQTIRQSGGLLSSFWPAPTATPTPLAPMPSGFNIAVAEFGALDVTGRLTSIQDSQELSDWLFAAIKNETNDLPMALRVNIRGPDEIGLVQGEDRDTRAANAAQIAARYNVTILIFGLVTGNNNNYQLELEFYVSDEGFGYGSEVAGPERLGKPVPFSLPLEPSKQFEINRLLTARTQALRHLVVGLSHFYIRDYEQAGLRFRRVLDIEDWRPEEGKEVVYLLLGAAKLRSYDSITNPGQLSEAWQAFDQARQLNPDYSRSYLGLGAVALEQAVVLNQEPTGIIDVDEAKLVEAQDWYSASLRVPEQPALTYVPIKAAYGLGQVHLLGFEHGIPGWSGRQARHYFDHVAFTYAAEPVPDLAWFGGHAHALLGRLAGHDRDWPRMSSEYRQAIDILDSLPGNPPRNWIARYWAQVAFAKERQGQPDIACEAYRQAIEAGVGTVGPKELESWQDKLDQLLEKGAC